VIPHREREVVRGRRGDRRERRGGGGDARPVDVAAAGVRSTSTVSSSWPTPHTPRPVARNVTRGAGTETRANTALPSAATGRSTTESVLPSGATTSRVTRSPS